MATRDHLTDVLAALQRSRRAARRPAMTVEEQQVVRGELATLIKPYMHHYRVKPKWEREHEGKSLTIWLRQSHSWHRPNETAKIVSDELAMDLGMDGHDLRVFGPTPAIAADVIERRLQDLRKQGFYGRQIKSDGSRHAGNKGGRVQNDQFSALLAGAISIFEKWAARPRTEPGSSTKHRFPTTTPGSAGMRYMEAVAIAAGYQKAGMKQRLADMIAELELTDNELDQRRP